MEYDKENHNTSSFSADEAVVGNHHDKNFKIQLCREFREILVEKGKPHTSQFSTTPLTPRTTFKRGAKKFSKQVDVTVWMLKNVPETGGKANPTPYVKIRLMPDDILVTTELQAGKMEAKYYETFAFPADDLSNRSLHIQVCDRKVTRRALVLGEVTVPLNDLHVGKSTTHWYNLTTIK